MTKERSPLMMKLLRPALAALALAVTLSPRPAAAQALAVIVNGDPITTIEVDEMMKYHRLIKQPVGRPEALEDLIGDRIKLRAANRGGIDATDASLAQALNQVAAKAKTNANAMLAEFQGAKLNIDLVRSHMRSVAAWNDLVKARYKALNVSQQEVDAALSKAGTAKADTDYTLQQIVFVVPVNASQAVIEQRMRDAQALRSRFQDCASGIPLARALPDVAIKPQITKTETSMPEATRTALSQIAKGRLTAPDRTAAGVEMIAVCAKDEESDRTSLRDSVQATLLTERLSKEADRMYKELRASAVVEKR